MSNKVIKNYLYNLAYQILVVVLPLVITPYLTRTLSIDGIGKYSSVYGIANLFYYGGMLGVLNYGSRQIAKYQSNVKERCNQFYSIWFIQLGAGIIFSILYVVLFIVLKIVGNSYFYLLMLPLVISSIFDISWFFIGIEDMSKTVLKNVITKLLTVICIFTLVKSENDLNLYFLIQSLSFATSMIVLWINIPQHVPKQKLTINIRIHINSILFLYIPIFFSQMYTCFDRTVIAFLANEAVSGYYDLSLKIAKIVNPCLTILGTALLPKITNLFAENNISIMYKYLSRSYQFTLFFSMIFCGGLITCADGFVQIFFGEEYTILINYIILSSLLVVFIPVGSFFSTQIALPLNKNKLFVIPIVVTAIIEFIFLFLLVPHLGLTGAVVANIIAEAICMVLRIILIKNEINILSITKCTYKYVAPQILAVVITLSVKQLIVFENNIIKLIFSGTMFVLLYMIICTCLKNEIIIYIVNIIKEKLLKLR